eukprot:3001990-Pyramimonas_sp.AAC.1
MARTLRQAQAHATDGTGSPPTEDEWSQVLSAIAWAAAIPQLDKSTPSAPIGTPTRPLERATPWAG